MADHPKTTLKLLSLAPADLDRLSKLLGMLGSEHAGERASAALKADQLVKARGSDWCAIIDGLKALMQPPPTICGLDVLRAKRRQPYQPMPGARPKHTGVEHQRRAMMCRLQEAFIGAWERDFLDNIMSLRTISAKQLETLNRIDAKISAALAAEREANDVYQY